MVQHTHQANDAIGSPGGFAIFAPTKARPLTQPDQSRHLVSALAVVTIVTALSAAVAIFAPDMRPLLLQEDGIVETASAMMFAMAFLGAVVATILVGFRAPLLLAGLIGFAELMDETSFGSRLFGYEPPPLYGGGQLDGFHDLFILVYRLLQSASQDLAWLWVGLMAIGALAFLTLALRLVTKGFAGRNTRLSSHTLLFLHFGFIGLAQVIDVAASSHILATPELAAMEEVFELDAAIVLVFYVLQQARIAPAAGPRPLA
ncbi:hypothetical protein [Manganibacter manganicus]|uniref:Uncharacterized protein n=1 Tax=Manganibacter manganicus TaxID=1873176 RepID=A0A1V8RKQ0_9HYPH|nr:hypothetical protein [Pseudaminobacter manganicus]OQM73696.1 hypothetical protein BFN67_07200 [Pseudaminobacter manganicus]